MNIEYGNVKCKLRVTSSDIQITSLNLQVMSSNPVTS